jgi:hypothetical protein
MGFRNGISNLLSRHTYIYGPYVFLRKDINLANPTHANSARPICVGWVEQRGTQHFPQYNIEALGSTSFYPTYADY